MRLQVLSPQSVPVFSSIYLHIVFSALLSTARRGLSVRMLSSGQIDGGPFTLLDTHNGWTDRSNLGDFLHDGISGHQALFQDCLVTSSVPHDWCVTSHDQK